MMVTDASRPPPLLHVPSPPVKARLPVPSQVPRSYWVPVVVSSWVRVHGLPTVMVYLYTPLVAAICVPAASDCSSDVNTATASLLGGGGGNVQLPSSTGAAAS